MTGTLRLATGASDLYPRDAAMMARTDLHQTRMLGFTPLLLDSVTTMLAGILNGHTVVRHEAGAGPEVLRLYRRAGLAVDERTLTYRTAEQAGNLADQLVAEGKRLFSPYPLPEGRYPDEAHLVPPGLFRLLNAKQNLEMLVPEANLPRRRVVDRASLEALEAEAPVFLKAGGDEATGWGFAVRYCPDQASLDAARRWFLARPEAVPSVIVEEAVEVTHCWGAGIAVTDSGTTCFGGAKQLLASPGTQSGSLIDPEAAMPPDAAALAGRIGSAAGALGFRGIAGLDIGMAPDGSLKVFDPNFRFTSTTSQLLLHPAAAVRAGLPVSLSFHVTVGGSFDSLAACLERPIDEAWFVPTRLFNASKHPLASGRHLVTGFVLGRDRGDAVAAAARLAAEIERCGSGGAIGGPPTSGQ